jgi:hypothetical protein
VDAVLERDDEMIGGIEGKTSTKVKPAILASSMAARMSEPSGQAGGVIIEGPVWRAADKQGGQNTVIGILRGRDVVFE